MGFMVGRDTGEAYDYITFIYFAPGNNLDPKDLKTKDTNVKT